MSDSPVNNREFVLKPFNKAKIDVGESTMFSKKVDTNLWETAAKHIHLKKPKENSLQSQIFKIAQETQKYEEALSQTSSNKIDYKC